MACRVALERILPWIPEDTNLPGGSDAGGDQEHILLLDRRIDDTDCLLPAQTDLTDRLAPRLRNPDPRDVVFHIETL